jgi:hypothetical protein
MNDLITVDGKTFRTDTQTAIFVNITPVEARALMERNTHNRTIRRDHVANLARDMAQGDWVMDGSAIRFDTTGALLDGQHRLAACIKANVPIRTLLITGLAPETSIIMDTGAKRTASDMLKLQGVSDANGNTIAAAIRILIGYSAGEVAQIRATNSEVYQVAVKHPDLAASVSRFGGCPAERSLMSALHYTMVADGLAKSAYEWRTTWVDGIPAYEGDPAHRLRERFLRERGSNVKTTLPVRRNLALNAYRHFIAKVPIRILKEHGDTRLAGWSLTRLGLAEREMEQKDD